jgi:hypothetical protein
MKSPPCLLAGSIAINQFSPRWLVTIVTIVEHLLCVQNAVAPAAEAEKRNGADVPERNDLPGFLEPDANQGCEHKARRKSNLHNYHFGFLLPMYSDRPIITGTTCARQIHGLLYL